MSEAGVRSPEQPKVTVVVASELHEGYVRPCLESLMPQAGRLGAQGILVQSGGEQHVKGLAVEFPDVQFLSAEPASSIPQLRFAGSEQARGDVIAWTEASAIVGSRWLEFLVEAHSRGFDAVGGAVDPDPTFDLTSWAAHLCEYGRFMSPLQGTEGSECTGFNVSYTHTLLKSCSESVRGRHWENVLNSEARSQGARFLLAGHIGVVNTRRYGVQEFMRQRLHYGYGYARVRCTRIPRFAHLALLALTAALPLLMLFRYYRWVWLKRLPPGRPLAALPLLILFAASWSLGEWWGYVVGLRS